MISYVNSYSQLLETYVTKATLCCHIWGHEYDSKGAIYKIEKLPVCFLILCCAHQFDLIIQELVAGILAEDFRSDIKSLSAHLRSHYKLREEMGSTCPLVAPTLWMSPGAASNWITAKRSQITNNCNNCATAPLPSSKWWILLSVLKRFMEPIDICFKAIQGMYTKVPEQNAPLVDLADNLKLTVEISDPLDPIKLFVVAGDCTLMSNRRTPEGTIVVRKDLLTSFIENCSL